MYVFVTFSRVDFFLSPAIVIVVTLLCFAERVLALRVHLKKIIHSLAIFIHANERISTAIKLYTVYLLLFHLWCRLVYVIFFVTLLLSIDYLKMQIDIQIHFVSLHFISTNGFCYFLFFFLVQNIFFPLLQIHSHARTHI